MLRVPTDRSDGKANLHQGGLGIGIDMEKGILTQGFDGRRHYDRHPDTGARLSGRPIPLWKEILALSVATSRILPLEYSGSDILKVPGEAETYRRSIPEEDE